MLARTGVGGYFDPQRIFYVLALGVVLAAGAAAGFSLAALLAGALGALSVELVDFSVAPEGAEFVSTFESAFSPGLLDE